MSTGYRPLRELLDALNAFIAYSRATHDLRDVSSVPYGWAESRIAVLDALHRAAQLIFGDVALPAQLHALLDSASIKMMQPEATPDELEWLTELRDALKPYVPERAASAGTPDDAAENKPPKRRWTQAEVDEAIREYHKKHRDKARELERQIRNAEGLQDQEARLISEARSIFGRNVLARKLGCPPALVTKSQPWRAVARTLKLIDK